MGGLFAGFFGVLGWCTLLDVSFFGCSGWLAGALAGGLCLLGEVWFGWLNAVRVNVIQVDG